MSEQIATSAPNSGLFETSRTFASLVKIEHTIFSLPFAVLGMLLAADGLPSLQTIILILLALTSARTAAMAFNRVVDRQIDSQNPRTAQRELVTGKLSAGQARLLTGAACAVFVVCAFGLNTTCGWLSFPTLVLLLGYSYTKRFTLLAHAFLGMSLGISPGAAWLAVGADVTTVPVILGFIVMTWVAGFDVIYSLADADFDRENQLHSIPGKLGIPRAIVIARVLHVICAGLMLTLFFVLQFPLWSYLTLIPTLALFVRQHTLVKPTDLSRVDFAFFTVNGWIGFLFSGATAVVYFLR